MKLDIGCGDRKATGHVGMDRQACDGVDVIHDWNDLPWPFENAEFVEARASHVVEHICPLRIIEWIDEVWRVLKVGGRLHIAMPYAGSGSYAQDPTHCLQATEKTWQYFDPQYSLHSVYRSRPWRVESINRHGDILNAVLVKRSMG